LTRSTVFFLLPRGGGRQLEITPAPAKPPWREGEPAPVVLQLIGNGDSATSSFQLNDQHSLRLVAYNFGAEVARGELAATGAEGALGNVEIAPGARVEWNINVLPVENVSVRLDLEDGQRSTVSARVTRLESKTTGDQQ
jgi:hypothetical protein